ncbi:hypothetical protein [Echinicola arenosa]|uniref:hypothetical protein n=1 Tax=Echinicola arenosa TaxID=2774144 RepID=UPI0037423F4D
MKGYTPKIIWLRMGNTTTKSIAEKMISMQSVIVDFILSDDLEELIDFFTQDFDGNQLGKTPKEISPR